MAPVSQEFFCLGCALDIFLDTGVVRDDRFHLPEDIECSAGIALVFKIAAMIVALAGLL